MSLYHYNHHTQSAEECHSMVSCPYGDLDQDHYLSPEAARPRTMRVGSVVRLGEKPELYTLHSVDDYAMCGLVEVRDEAGEVWVVRGGGLRWP